MKKNMNKIEYNQFIRRFKLIFLTLFLVLLLGVNTYNVYSYPLDNSNNKEMPQRCTHLHCDIFIPGDNRSRGYMPDLWTDGIVYYQFDSNVNSVNRLRAIGAMQEWIDTPANVAFVPRLNEPYYIHISDSEYNRATVGMKYPGQTFDIVSWNDIFIIAHELGHTLGFWHEQSRPDRDSYVSIIEDNIDPDKLHNFDIEPYWITLDTDYDFLSIMHYDQCAFSLCDNCPSSSGCDGYDHDGITIKLKPQYEVFQNIIGQRSYLSDNDVIDMKNAYGTGYATYVDHQTDSIYQDGSLHSPYKNFIDGYNNNPINGNLLIRSGYYEETGLFDKKGIWRSYLGDVTVG